MFFVRLAEFVLRQRILIALILGIMLVVALNGASRVVPDFTLTAFFGGNDPAREYLDTYIEKWGPDDAVILVIITAEDGTILTRERLQIIEEVSQALQSKKESVKTTRSISNMERVLSRNEADVSVLETRKVLETMPSDTDEESVAWKTWRAELPSAPHLSPLFISKDGKGSGMVLDLQKSTDNVIVVGPMVDEIRAVLESFNGRAGLHFATAGMPAVRADFFALFFQDSKLFGGLSFVMVFFCMLFVFRSVHGVIIPSIAAGFPVMMVFGLMGYSGENMGIINQSYITVLPAIAIADAIHLLTRFHEEARRMAAPGERLTPEQRENAIKKALSKVGVACLLTSLTTAVGFGSLYVAEMPTIQSFGYFAGLGIIFAYGSILFIIPLCLSFVRGIPKEREDKAPWLDRILKRCAQISIYRPGIVLFATTLIVAGCIYLGSFVVLDNQITNLLDEEHPTTQANLILDEKLGGHLTLEIDFVDHHPPLPPADLGVFEEELDEEEIVFDLEEDFDDSPQEVAITNKEEDVRPTPMLKNAEILRAM